MESTPNFVFKFESALDCLARCSEVLRKKLSQFVKLKSWQSQDKQALLHALSELILDEDCALYITKFFKPIILEVLQRCARTIQTQEESIGRNHELFSCILSILLPIVPNIQSFILEYFSRNKPFYVRMSKIEGNNPEYNDMVYAVTRTAYNFLVYDFNAFAHLWDWSLFLKILDYDDTAIRWLATHVVAMVTQMSDQNKVDMMNNLFTSEEQIRMTLEMDKDYSRCDLSIENDQNCNSLAQNSADIVSMVIDEKQSEATFTEADFTGNHIAISGVVLPALQKHSQGNSIDSLVMVPSTRRNLHSLAIAIATGSGVLLEGPVGSGKTCLVEYIARMTGRVSAPALMKVQLGDQTDSKSLLGTYICTDTPGEFVWQPGVLLQAIQGGHWVLLEDIDYAPMDVVSVLIPLLESRALSVPGHGNVVKAAPGFHLFATQRMHSSSGYSFHAHSNSSILDRLWTKVNVEPLTKEELNQVICMEFPDLSSVSHKLIDIYCMVSSDTSLVTKPDTALSSLSHDKRLSTTRDLMKWTSRLAMSTSNGPFFTDAKDVFLEAQDCFGATLSKVEKRVELGMAIGAKLGINKEKVEFFCRNYKPKVHLSPLSLTVGRVSLHRQPQSSYAARQVVTNFAHTRHSLVLLERVAVCIQQEEPILLVGETGTGKTSSVQNLAALCRCNLKVINMSQQSDSADLLGGFKPVEMKQLVGPAREYFEKLFCETFSRKQNTKYLSHIQQCYAKGQWEILFKLMTHSYKSALDRIGKGAVNSKVSAQELLSKWHSLTHKIEQLRKQQKHAETALAFQFVEGTLVKAIRDGDWILLDEINLATPETLECLSGLLESSAGSVVLLERGDVQPIVRHDNFRLFACMNPATDVGKKDLPPGIRNRFTEIFVDELEDVNDLKTLVVNYLQGLSPTAAIVDGIVRFYLTARHEASDKLTDGTGHKPHYSLRTLCRALKYASSNPHGNVLRSIYEGFCLSFLTQLDRSSHPVIESLIRTNILGHVNATSLLNQPLPCPDDKKFVNFEGFWINVGKRDPVMPSHYVLTASVKANLKDLARVVSGRTFPVLIQGETSVGKTSLIQWLASASGNQCVRINNHEHTDIQEYLGCYTSDHDGRLVFKEGVLVDAMRKGYWIILDELNLAPTDVLEALNRLLDDNRELFIAETQETVKAHPNFMLYATQNPPGQYGGRKVLSRAFRNRFVELHFDELPSKELEKILHLRGDIPMSYAKKMIAVMIDLQARRRSTSVFAGKQGFITLRDLFRWAERYSKNPDVDGGFHDWEQHLAEDGYMLLAGRCRKLDECSVIQDVLQVHFKRKLDPESLFTRTSPLSKTPFSSSDILEQVTSQHVEGFNHVVWTRNMKRLAVLVGRALHFGEPVLLVGETGCGKTTICQLFSALKHQHLYSVNCHMHSESSDFLGGLRPVRNHHLDEQDGKLQKFFEWCDGPLVLAMKEGAMFLIDEISLADDSVLERLNSVLEPERTLVLAEKGSEGGGVNDKDVDIIKANDEFRVVATMNPGGDFGKKELSPALRNRFTEIWCQSSNSDQDLIDIIEHNLIPGLSFKATPDHDGQSGIGKAMVEFVNWFHSTEFGRRFVVSIRDLLSWIRFINTCCQSSHHVTQGDLPSHQPPLHPTIAYLHGACLVFLDALGAGLASTGLAPQEARSKCMEFLRKQVESGDSIEELNMNELSAVVTQDAFGIKPFYIPRGPLTACNSLSGTYALNAPTTSQNAQRLLRALQLARPILLEGSPGVGKTSLVNAIAKASGHELVRINLSEQTDITDLFGADLPVEGGDPGMFTWRDGPLLRALKAGHWIVLDELNLASQSVLEGLNACLDHRAEVYIPELGMTFKVQHEKTHLFACQNPLNQGGGRKGLPKSFLNRFTQVYVEPLLMEDLLFITTSLYPSMNHDVLQKMIMFNMQLHQETVVEATWGKRGSPWEFNLRDVFRWCDLYLKRKSSSIEDLFHFAKLIYSDRMRTFEDKTKVIDLIHKVFDVCHGESCINKVIDDKPRLHITPTHLQVGYSFLPRRPCISCTSSPVRSLQVLHHDLPYMESLMKCIEMSWMTILVGQRSCGKSSLVQMTAELTGNKLEVLAMNSSMDTTELLGGFEQANLNIHWQSILNDAKILIKSLIRMTLLRKFRNGSSMDAFQLYKKWELFLKPNVPDDKEQENGSDAGDLNSTKIDKLIEILHDVSFLDSGGINTDSLKARALDLKRKLKANRGSAHCGGQFEWVDGQLVEALKSGYWLLIDNVNFCSPSVLDRLNSLLEPDGVLSINERGVIDGKVPSVKPHPDFRLILTMDPKFGEISRAMRNRGVEIYVSGEDDESTGYDEHDLQVMLYGAGVRDDRTRETLLAFHKEYKDNLGGSVLDLLHAATMITNLLHRGEDLGTAVLTSLNQVYVRSHVHEADRQVAEDLVNKFTNYETVLSDDGVTSCVVHSPPSVSEFSENSTLSTIKWHCTPIHQLLWKHQSPEFLQHAVDLLIERSSFSDWQLRCEYLTSLLGENDVRFDPTQHAMVLCLVAMAKGVVTKIFDCSLMEGIKKIYEAFTTDKSDLDILAHQPYNIRLNRHLQQQLTLTKDGVQGVESQLISLCNRLQIHYMRVKQTLMESQKKSLSSKTNQKTLLDLSRDLHQGLVSMEMLPHPTVAHLFPFFKCFNDFVDRLIALECALSNEGLSEALESLEWSSRLHKMCSSSKPFSLSLLSLHWQWFVEKTLRVLPLIVGYSDSDFPSDLKTVINQISRYLGTDTNRAKTHLQIASDFGHPLAFKSEPLFQNWIKLVQLCHVFELSWRQDMTSYEETRLANQIQFLVTEGPKARGMLCGEIAHVLNKKNSIHNEMVLDSQVDKVIEEVSAVAASHGILQSRPHPTPQFEDMVLSNHKSDPQRNPKRDSLLKVALLPLCEVIGSSQEYNIMAELYRLLIETKTIGNQESFSKSEFCSKLDSLVTFLMTNSTRSPLVLAMYRAVQSSISQGETDLSTLIKSVDSHLMYSLLTAESNYMTSMNIAKWIMPFGRCNGPLDAEPRVLMQGDLDSYLFKILNNQPANHKRSDTDDSLSCVAIGNHKEKTEQLAVLVRHIWSNADHVTNLANQNRHSEIALFASKFAQVLLSLAVLMETSDVKDEACRIAMAISRNYNAAHLEENLEKISRELFCCYETQTGSKDGVTEMNQLLTQSFSHFHSCINARLIGDKASESREEEHAFYLHSGSMWVNLGLLQAHILTPIGPVDPVEQSAIELQYVQDEINDIKQELEVRLYAEQLWAGVTISVDEIEQELENGRDPTSLNITSNPVRVQMLAQKLKKARERERVLARDTAVRPKPSKFGDILHSILHYKSTIGNPQTVLQMIATLQQALSTTDFKMHHDDVKQRQAEYSAQNIIQRVDTWSVSQKKFMLKMKNDFPLYGDVIGPFISAVSQVVYGINTLSSCLQRRLHRHSFLVKCPDLQPAEEIVFPEHLIAILCGSTLDRDNLEASKELMSGATWSCLQALKSFQSPDDGNALHSKLTSRVVWTSLLYVRNHTIKQGYLNTKTINSLLEILNHYTNQWTLAKDEEQKRQQQEDSLFKFKTTSYEGEVDEEKAFEMGLCKAFPSFDNEFSEFIQSNSLEEVRKKPQDTESAAQGTTDAEKFMKNVDTQKISSLHEGLFCGVPICLPWVLIGQLPKPCCHGDTDVELLETGYQTALVVSFMNEQTGCYESIGAYKWETHLIRSQYMLQRLAAIENVSNSSDKHYDIYHDPIIPEVIKVRPVMASLGARLDVLLAEWPDHPLLTQLQSFIDKILSLPVTSPVMKVLTGVELLLKNAQEWEANASRHVSIKEHLDGMIQLVIEWRKLELKCWSSLLDVATVNVSSKASIWWFYLYSLVQQTFATDSEANVPELVDPLQRFLESSSLGEFSSRLKMLYSFYQQCITMEIAMAINHQPDNGKLSNVILNIYTYYKQFSEAVQQKIQQARDPIEKELKGYVKIAKWNDSNFWAMKQATEKSHRTLHKFVRRYEMALSEPVRGLLMDPKKTIGSIQQDSAEVPRDIVFNPDWFISPEKPLEVKTHQATLPHDVTNQLERLPKLFSKMKKLCHGILSQHKYLTLVSTLDDLTGEIITNVHDLQALDITNQPKEKRKEMRKHIHLRKRTSLAELFKLLSSLGLSHKKGLQNLNQSASQDSSMLLPALDDHIINNVHADMPSDVVEAARYHANRGQHYYYRCLARMSALHVHIASPSKELTMGDIDRCKGYTHHLLRITQNQRKVTIDMANSIALLRLASRSLTTTTDKERPALLPPQDEVPHRMGQFMELLIWVHQILQRSLRLLKCCPEEQFTQDCSPVPQTTLSAVATSSSQSEVIQQIQDTLQNCLAHVDKLASEVRPYIIIMESLMSGNDGGNYILASWKHIDVLNTSVGALQTIGENIDEVLPHFTSSNSYSNGLGGSLLLLTQRIKDECEKVELWSTSLVQDEPRYSAGLESSLPDKVDKTITALLLAVQRIYKVTEARNAESIADEQDDEESLLDGHLVSHVYNNMIDEVTKLDLNTVQTSVKVLISHLKDVAGASVIPNSKELTAGHNISCSLVSLLVPLFNQYVSLAHSYLLNLLSSHQTCCKFLSVLLGIFTELAEKGFCLPPEMDEEESGEGATEFEDIEDGGLGEGEGAKDVSDQIENEDQLQDAKKEGQEEEKQDNTQQQIPEEENAIEMSDDFDGVMHDAEGEEQDEENSGDEEEDEEPDKQMGELDGEEDEKLDEKMWGDSDDEEDKEDKEGESEKGAGAEAETESEVVAKEDNKDAVDESKDKEKQPQEHEDEENVNELPKDDSGNLSDEEVDPQGEGKDEQNTPENEAGDLDLPENLEIDDENQGEENEGEDETSEMNMDDIEEEMDVDQDGSLEESQDKDQDEQQDGQQDGQQDEQEDEKDNEVENQKEGEEPVEDNEEDDWKTKHETEAQDDVQAVEDSKANDGGSDQNEVVEETAGQSEPNDNQEKQGVGSAMAAGNEGHSGEAKVTSAQSTMDTKQQQRKQMNRSRSDRSLGSMDERTHKRLKTVEESQSTPPTTDEVKMSSDLYQHMSRDDQSKHDTQTFDSATADQTRQQDGARFPEHQSDQEDEGSDEEMEDAETILKERDETLKQIHQQKSLPQSADTDMKSQEESNKSEEDVDKSSGSRDKQKTADRTRSSYHVSHEALFQEKQDISIDTNKLRSDLEHQLSVWCNLDHGTVEEQRLAQSAWHKYELLTSSLAQELCEQLRLVLEPSLATKLKGDYRTGKRLNMRKVIPYIASQFRKDKIWLRRTKPSKREYQVMIAVDDSSSMADNHSKQLAFESLAVISKALTRLEAGDLAVCSFGETVKLLHPVHEPFTDQSGARILQQFKFDQKKTKIAELVNTCSSLMISSRSRLQGGARSRGDTSQLLLVVSDGRGVFLEGVETVKRAVRAAKEAGIFLVFVIIDNPINRDSILDIKVPIFRPGKPPEIKSYIEQFPFPFYVILRDINSLPITLSDALRQWFELVTSMDN